MYICLSFVCTVLLVVICSSPHRYCMHPIFRVGDELGFLYAQKLLHLSLFNSSTFPLHDMYIESVWSPPNNFCWSESLLFPGKLVQVLTKYRSELPHVKHVVIFEVQASIPSPFPLLALI